jgi:hypothetical protein
VWYGKPLPRAPLESVRGYVTEIRRAAGLVWLYEAVLNQDEAAAAELLRHYPRVVVLASTADNRRLELYALKKPYKGVAMRRPKTTR